MLSAKDVKYYSSLKHKKHREEQKRFLIEGFHLMDECLSSAYELECVLLDDGIDRRDHQKIFDLLKIKRIPVHTLKPVLFNKLPETKNSQGIIGVVKQKPQGDIKDIESTDLLIALEKINDPGNLGTIIRTAYWFGADGILLSQDSVDLYNSKVIRSTQGAFFHINIYQNIELKSNLKVLDKKGFNIYLLTPTAQNPIEKMGKSNRTVFVFGNESGGLSSELLDEKYEKLTIPGYSNCESLNLAVSCGIVLYHFKTSVL